MRHASLIAIMLLAASPRLGFGQRGGTGGPGMGGGAFGRRSEPKAPKLPGPELDGPPDTLTLGPVVDLTDEQAKRYAQVRDSFMLATKTLRDSAQTTRDVMYQKLDSGDRVAALFYADRLQQLGKRLRDQQDKFEDRLSRVLTGDQMKAYHQWRKEQDAAAEAKALEEAGRWRELPFGMERPAVEEKVFIDDPSLARPEAGSPAVRVGRTIYTSSQVAVDRDGNIVGEGDLRTQAVRAFANLTAVLQASGALPTDVVRLTVYVVNYQAANLEAIREAGTAYFPARNQPIITILGVQSLSRPGLLIAVEATAVPGAAAPRPRGPGRER